MARMCGGMPRGSALRLVVGVAALVALGVLWGCCGTREPVQVAPPAKPVGQVLAEFAAAHGRRDLDAIRSHFAEGARLRSPAMPRPGNPDGYLRAMLAEPFTMVVSGTEVLYANALGAKTRSRVHLSAPARFSIDGRIEVIWKLEDGRWKIDEIEYPEWPMFVGAWRKAALRGEESIELRILPGGTYLVYAERDRTVPSFRGRYEATAGTISFTDSSASSSANLDTSEGRYAVTVTRTNADFRKISDSNRWRTDRFGGVWTAAE
jgi:ketosteroid isomerase-like protein